MTYETRAKAFAALHQPGDPVVLYNIWDAGSARAIAGAGAKAIATGSHPLAAAQGYEDGEQIPLDRLLETATQIIGAVELPVTIDFEGGYARGPDALTQNVTQLVKTGAVGLNFEDQIVGQEGLYSIAEQSTRLAAVRSAEPHLFINARTDLFLKEKDTAKHAGLMTEALERAAAYAEVGGSCFFVPGLRDLDLIARICADCPLPVNAFMRGITLEDARQAGAARASFGPIPHSQLMEILAEQFQQALR